MGAIDLKNILKSVDETRIDELRLSLDEYLAQDIAEGVQFAEGKIIYTNLPGLGITANQF